MIERITQGSIITNVRSQKYQGLKCYAIVISARCDLAQGKIDCVHAISAVPLLSWVQTVVFQKALTKEIESQLRTIEKWAQDEGQDMDSLIELGPDKAIINVKEGSESKAQKAALQACNLWKKYLEFKNNDVPLKEIASFLNDKGKSTRVSTLNELFSGSLNNYCFIPESAYMDNKNVCEGLVADFKDIIPFSINQIEAIQRGDYDYLRILETPKNEELNKQFYLETGYDIVEAKYLIKPPWIEWLMQNFAFSFIRIGVDTITKEQRKTLSRKSLKANGKQLAWDTEDAYETA